MAFSIRIGNGYVKNEIDHRGNERSFWWIEDHHHPDLPFRSSVEQQHARRGDFWNNNHETLSNGGFSYLLEGVNYEVFNHAIEPLTEEKLYKLQEHKRAYMASLECNFLPPGVDLATWPLKQNYYLAILINLEWLMQWALKNCANPCISTG